MRFKIGDLVTRISHKHDIVFKIVDFVDNLVYLKGVDLRLYADADINDLMKSSDVNISDNDVIREQLNKLNLNRSEYFYLPGKILHIDGDKEYLDRCMNFYENMNVKANGLCLNEEDISDRIGDLITEFKPDIVVITGHDSYNSRKDNNYQNTDNFINAVISARRYEKSQDKLLIIAGACQSNYEELIRAGANFASSPKRVNIHALDPAIVAVSLALSDRNKSIDLIEILKKTKYGSDGLGGIITNGTMYVGYPR